MCFVIFIFALNKNNLYRRIPRKKNSFYCVLCLNVTECGDCPDHSHCNDETNGMCVCDEGYEKDPHTNDCQLSMYNHLCFYILGFSTVELIQLEWQLEHDDASKA